MATLKETREKLEAKQAVLAAIFEKAKNEAGQYDFASLNDPFFGESKTTKEKLEKVHQAEAELNDLVDEAEKLSKAEKGWDSFNERMDKAVKTFPHATGKEKNNGEREFKSLGEEIAQSEEYAKWGKKGGIDFRFDEMYPSDALAKAGMPKTLGLKALMVTTAGYAPESIRIPGFVEAVTRPIQLLDIIPIGQTSYENVVYMEETTRTHAAAEKAEGVAFAESAFAFTEKTSAVRKITDSLPVTDEQLEDVPFIEGYINDRLLFGLRQRLDTQVLLGNGIAPNLQGIKTLVGIQTQAKGADPTPDAFFKAMTKLRVTGRVMPTHHIIHPSDWEEIRLLRTADGIYIWGNPSESGPERMWGLRVVQVDADVAGTGYTISAQPQWMSLFERRGVETQVGYIGTQFVEGKRTVRADMRFAYVVFRPASICSVTGI